MNDKVIVITGASEGIGAELARECAKRGASVVLASRRKPALEAVARDFANRSLCVETDVTKRADNTALRDAAIKRFGRIDVWVANAGRGISRMVSELTDDDIDQMVTINVKSVVYAIQAVLPHFKERGQGQIIAVSSGLSRLPFAPQRSAYSASKAAVNLLMASLRGELRSNYPAIFATTVLPGVVTTNFGVNALHGGVDNRKLPNAQSTEEVAQIIAGAIEKPRAELYTRSQMKDLAARYFSADDVAAIEAQLAGPPPQRG